MTEEEFNQALDIGIAACRKINEMQIEALKRKYLPVKEHAEEKQESSEVST